MLCWQLDAHTDTTRLIRQCQPSGYRWVKPRARPAAAGSPVVHAGGTTANATGWSSPLRLRLTAAAHFRLASSTPQGATRAHAWRDGVPPHTKPSCATTDFNSPRGRMTFAAAQPPAHREMSLPLFIRVNTRPLRAVQRAGDDRSGRAPGEWPPPSLEPRKLIDWGTD
ncbi:hypothetical protein OH77DRAFT_560631 [Trametes cingulata]|nr:hypothetical protein OH77DRAFT_560631 [Trametes cingulata]